MVQADHAALERCDSPFRFDPRAPTTDTPPNQQPWNVIPCNSADPRRCRPPASHSSRPESAVLERPRSPAVLIWAVTRVGEPAVLEVDRIAVAGRLGRSRISELAFVSDGLPK